MYDFLVKAALTLLVVIAASSADVILSFIVFVFGALLGAGLLVLVDIRQRGRHERRRYSRRTS